MSNDYPKPQKSRFRTDIKKAQTVNEYMDKYYYSTLSAIENTIVVRSESGSDLDFAGCDLVIIKDGKVNMVDEKAAINYMHKDLGTFALEISYLKDGVEKEGWLIDEDKKTEAYILIWPRALGKSNVDNYEAYDNITVDEISYLECMYIKRSDILKELDSYGLSVERLKKITRMIRNSEVQSNNGRYYFRYKNSGKKCETMWFTISKGLSEEPINLVCKKYILNKLSQYYRHVNRDGYIDIEILYDKVSRRKKR